MRTFAGDPEQIHKSSSQSIRDKMLSFQRIFQLLITAHVCQTLVHASVFANLQPNVTHVEWDPQQMSYGSISLPEGSPWCGGNSTVWSVAHQKQETPWCLDHETGVWSRPGIAMLDDFDLLDGKGVDRHDCTTLDVNKDGLVDIICVVGANQGTGAGYNELYLTQPDGSLVLEPRHAMQYVPTCRTRLIEPLHNKPDGDIDMVFVGASATVRDDGFENQHYLYRVLNEAPWFELIRGDWEEDTRGSLPNIARNIHVADWNGDGRDDFILCHDRTRPMVFEQGPDGAFFRIPIPQAPGFNDNWLSSSVGEFNGDEFPDLVVTTRWFKNDAGKFVAPQLFIFPGIDEDQRWDFENPYYEAPLKYRAKDIEILDVNGDGLLDIYVVQTAKKKGTYCGSAMPFSLRNNGPKNTFVGGPPGYVAPIDDGVDFLFVGAGPNTIKELRFERIRMEHQLPGCGYRAEKFGDDKTMLLINGDADRFGPTSILSW